MHSQKAELETKMKLRYRKRRPYGVGNNGGRERGNQQQDEEWERH